VFDRLLQLVCPSSLAKQVKSKAVMCFQSQRGAFIPTPTHSLKFLFPLHTKHKNTVTPNPSTSKQASLPLPTMALDLKGKRCLVTGATEPTSVGYVSALACLAAGAAKVVVVGRDLARMASPVPAGLSGLEGNLKKPETMAELVAAAVEQLGGGVDVLIISGGNGYSEYLGLDPTDAASYHLMYDMAVLSPMFLVAAAAPHLSQAPGGGSVVMVSSVAAQRPWPDTAPFNLAKAAQNALVETLAFKHRQDGFRVNGVLPGCIHTKTLDVMAVKKGRDLAEYAELRAKAIPMGRNGKPEEVAQVVLFLASPASSYMTGTLLPVDGGLGLSSWFNTPRLLSEYVGGTKVESTKANKS